jgi:hypothetical protein
MDDVLDEKAFTLFEISKALSRCLIISMNEETSSTNHTSDPSRSM